MYFFILIIVLMLFITLYILNTLSKNQYKSIKLNKQKSEDIPKQQKVEYNDEKPKVKYNNKKQKTKCTEDFSILNSESIDKNTLSNEYLIKKNVVLVEENSFINYKQLSTIKVDDNNINYTSKGGVLFSKDMKDIVCYPPSKKSCTYFIPQGITKISPYAFVNNDNIKYLIIPTSISDIGENSFVNCKNLSQIAIPKNIENINPRAFNLCPRLTIKCYKNSVAEEFCKKYFIPLDYLDL